MVAPLILAVIITIIVVVIGIVDFAAFRKQQPRALVLEALGFVGIVVLAFWSDGISTLAKVVGIGRGVDLIIYPMLIWLFREAVLGRVRYHRQQAHITKLLRKTAKMESRLQWPAEDRADAPLDEPSDDA
jgi:hypothetical protein